MIPIFLNFRNRLPRTLTPWSLGRLAPLINAIAWCVFIAVVFVLPPNELVLWTMVGLAVVMAVYWFGWRRSRFSGPAAGRA